MLRQLHNHERILSAGMDEAQRAGIRFDRWPQRKGTQGHKLEHCQGNFQIGRPELVQKKNCWRPW